MIEQKYDDYWLSYIAGHSKPMTRYLHYFGLFAGPVLGLLLSIFVVWWAVLIVGPASYFVALKSHPHVEGNSNKPFATRPLWSVLSFFRMMLLDLTGGLDKQLMRLQ